MRRYDCFILRIWRTEGEHGEQWAGRIEHASGTESLRFGDPEILLQYLREHIAPSREHSSRQCHRSRGEGDAADNNRVERTES